MPRLVSVDQIKIQNRIRKEYGDIEELAKSIREVGLLHPIIITKDYILITGERRLMAAKKLGWKEIKAEIMTATNREKQLLIEIAENEKRKDFTPSERIAYGRELEQIEKLKAKERQATSTGGEKPQLRFHGTQAEKGKAREKVGEKVGLSGTSYYRAKKVVESGDKELIDKMDSGEIGIATAYERVKPKKPDKSKRDPDQPVYDRNPKLNLDEEGAVDFKTLFDAAPKEEEQEVFHQMADEAELMGRFREAICIPIVSNFLLKSLKKKLTEYPDTPENADNPDRKAFVSAFNTLKKIVRGGNVDES